MTLSGYRINSLRGLCSLRLLDAALSATSFCFKAFYQPINFRLKLYLNHWLILE